MASYVVVKGEKIEVKDGMLDLNSKGIKDVTEIKGLDALANLQKLDLGSTRGVPFLAVNQITEIKGLDKLTNLQTLNLHNNQINEIKGLDKLTNLQTLNLHNNQINEIKGLDKLMNLQKLHLADNQINEIKGLDKLTNLQKLFLGDNQITEIKGLDALTNLQLLHLSKNQITEIKGLDALTNLIGLFFDNNQITEIKDLDKLAYLQTLNLYNNQITEIRGLDKLTDLKFVYLGGNIIPEAIIKELRGLKGKFGYAIQPQKFLQYCQKKRKKQERLEKERKKQERLEKEREKERLYKENLEKIKKDTTEFITNSTSIYKELKFKRIQDKTGIDLSDLGDLLEYMIYNKQLYGQIKGNTIIFKEPSAVKPPTPVIDAFSALSSTAFNKKKIDVLRGGDWKVEGDQSVFFYKVKVKNNSELVINNIQILLTSIPGGLTADKDKYKIDMLKPGSLESPTFKLMGTESCVGDTVEGIVSYTDPTGTQQSSHIEPFEICYVCNLLTPKEISKQEFDMKTQFMEDKKLIIDSDLDITALEAKIEQVVKNCNFALLKNIQATQNENYFMFEAFAEGLYDKQDVALSVAVQKAEEGSKLVVKAMSDRAEKVTDLLRDFSIKLDDIKSDTELIKEYTSQIEVILNNQEDIESYLKDRLASDWVKIKDAYQDYKAGNITMKDLVKKGLKTIGKKFVKKVIGKVIAI